MERRITIRIRELRRSHSLTQEELAEALGLSRQSVNALEAGRCLPSLPVALQIAAYFGVPLHSVFLVDEQPPAQPLNLDGRDESEILHPEGGTAELAVWSPLQAMLNGLMDERASEQLTASMPAVNVSQNEKEVHVEMRLPGFSKEQLDLEVGEDFLTVKGEQVVQAGSEQQYYRREFLTQNFSRTVGLPAAVQPDKATAEMKHGLLTVTLPKQGEPKPKTTRLNIEGK